MARLFGRKYELNLNGSLITDLHIEFSITHTDKPSTNDAEIKIYNLSPATRLTLSQADDPFVELVVGYEEETATLFRGRIRRGSVTTYRTGTEWVTVVDAGDGETQAKIDVDVSFPAGAKVEDVVGELVESTGLGIGNLKKQIGKNGIKKGFSEYIRGATFSGNAHNAITRLGKGFGLRVSVQDEEYVATPLEDALETQGYLISPNTGLIGNPEIGEKETITVRSLLLPTIRPHHKVKVESAAVEGFYRVRSARHTGSWRGDDWTTELDLKEI